MINRRDFLKFCAAVGLGALVGCAEEGFAFEPLEGRYDGRVVIVGAGAAGIFAGEAYTQHDDWGSVHDAARAAREVVAMLLE